MIRKRLSELVLTRDGHVCQLNLVGCTYTATEADHRANRGMGGSKLLDNAANLVAACRSCNGRKETLTGDALDDVKSRGLRLVHGSTPAQTLASAADTPAQYRTGDWYFLDTTGHRTISRKSDRA
jgi:hypothetical protein